LFNATIILAYGVGYAWNPSTLDVTAGDEVTFIWSYPPFVTGPNIGLFTTQNPLSTEYDGVGFKFLSSQAGMKIVAFCIPKYIKNTLNTGLGNTA